ncbi:TPA: NAD(P)H-binding protein [Escherichia coli]|nr:NAD(P)H-binding protein [Escherichia coli]
MRILVAGATGSIGIHVVNTAIAMGHQPVALVRNRRKIKLLPRGTDIFYGDVSIPETLTDLPKDIDAIIFTLGSDGQGRIGARAIDYGGVRNILRIFMDTPVRIALMTTIGVTERLSSWNQRTEVHDWKRRSERLVRASGHIYTIVRPGWFDYNNDDEHRIVMLQGDRRHAGTPEDGVISREQIAQVLVTALSNDAAKNKTFELVADTLALQSSAAGSAQNVGIQILDRTGEVLVLDGATFSAKTDLIDGTNILPFQARYIALGQSVAGTANADATFKVQYL